MTVGHEGHRNILQVEAAPECRGDTQPHQGLALIELEVKYDGSWSLCIEFYSCHKESIQSNAYTSTTEK